jgi:ATP-dependent Lon protease
VATGLAWTPAGGDLMFIEAVAMPGAGNLVLTGQLGEVMRESAQAAISFARSRAESFNLKPDFFRTRDIHIHLPHGAIPKDGPSAGLGMVVALASLVSQIPARPEVGVTGEISLRGLVLPVGGLKEKILAAKRAGLSTIIVPEKNLAELAETPGLTDNVTIVPVRTVDEAVHQALLGGAVDIQPFCQKYDALKTPSILAQESELTISAP